eukprot:1181448-Prorocentrum_minimum.AAC.3
MEPERWNGPCIFIEGRIAKCFASMGKFVSNLTSVDKLDRCSRAKAVTKARGNTYTILIVAGQRRTAPSLTATTNDNVRNIVNPVVNEYLGRTTAGGKALLV